MKLRTKLTLDKFIGIPMIFLLSITTKISRYLFRFRAKDDRPVKKIAVCKFLGMGSIIQSTPLLLTLRKNYSAAEITYITSISNYELIRNFPFIDNICSVDDRYFLRLLASVAKISIRLLREKTDLYIDLEVHSFFSTVISAFSAATIKIGFYAKEEWTKRNIYNYMIYYNARAPVTDVYLQAARLVGCKVLAIELYEFNELISGPNEFLNSKLKETVANVNSEYIVINPNASDLRIERRWHYENYSELINKILEADMQKMIFLTGSKNEVEYVEKIHSKVNREFSDRVINTSGKLSIEELILLISKCSLMITNDSGPMHLAFALNKKVVALFGPCSPQQYITQKNVVFIYSNIYCSPCVHQFTVSPCNGDNQCMKTLTTSEVFGVVNDVLTNKITPGKDINYNQIIYTKTVASLPFGILNRK